MFQIFDALEALQIPYMVVGSFASTFWGRPHLAHDADLVVQIASEKVVELARPLAPHFYAPEFVIEDALLRKVGLLREADTPPLAGRMMALLDLASRLPRQVWYHEDPQAHDQRCWRRYRRAVC